MTERRLIIPGALAFCTHCECEIEADSTVEETINLYPDGNVISYRKSYAHIGCAEERDEEEAPM